MLVEIAPDIWVNPDDVSSVDLEAVYGSPDLMGRTPSSVIIRFRDSRTKRLPQNISLQEVVGAINGTCAYKMMVNSQGGDYRSCVFHGAEPSDASSYLTNPYQPCSHVVEKIVAVGGKRAKRD